MILIYLYVSVTFLCQVLQKGMSKEQHSKLYKEFKAVRTEAQRALRIMQEKLWSELANEIQNAANSNNTKQMYYLMKQVFGPVSIKIALLRTEEGNGQKMEEKL